MTAIIVTFDIFLLSIAGMATLLNRHSVKLELGVLPDVNSKKLKDHIIPVVREGSRIWKDFGIATRMLFYKLSVKILLGFKRWFGPWARRVEARIIHVIDSLNGKRKLSKDGKVSDHLVEIRNHAEEMRNNGERVEAGPVERS